MSNARPRVGFAFNSRDRIGYTVRALASMDSCGGYDLVWVDGSTSPEGRALPDVAAPRNVRIVEVHRGVGGGPDAAIRFGLQRLIDLGYDYCGLIENDMGFEPGWFPALMSLFENGAGGLRRVGAATVSTPESRILAHCGDRAVLWNVGAAMALFSRDAAQVVLENYGPPDADTLSAFYRDLVGADIEVAWELRMGRGNRRLGCDWGYAMQLYRHGFACVGTVPCLAVHLDRDFQREFCTTYAMSPADPSPAEESVLSRLREHAEHSSGAEPLPSCLPSTDLAARAPNRAPVTWHADLFQFSGYARLSRDIVTALDRRGTPVALRPGQPDPAFVRYLEQRPDETRGWCGLVDRRSAGGLLVTCRVPVGWTGADFYTPLRSVHPGHDGYAALTMFETDRLPSGWAAACGAMDEIWVPSEFNRRTFVESGVDPARIQVIPCGIEAELYDPERVSPLEIPGRRGFTFLSVFQWSLRKGWDVLLKAYLSSFDAADDVCLVLRTCPGYVKDPPIRERIANFIRGLDREPDSAAPIIVLDELLPDDQMAALYRAADAFVLPTRGEGWGIPFMEAMAASLPTIGTRWSAHLDFMNDQNSYLIDVDDLEPVDPAQTAENPFYGRDHRWARPSVAHTASLMRHVFDRREEARATGVRARADVQRDWRLARTADWIAGRAAVLTDRSSRRPTRVGSTQSGAPVRWCAPLYDPSGYAEEARHFVLALESSGCELAAQHVPWGANDRRAELPEGAVAALGRMASRQLAPGGVNVCHLFPPRFVRDESARLNIGRTMFETDRLPDGWADACNRMDRIWVPSEFNRKTFARAGVDEAKLAVVPGTIDVRDWNPEGAPLVIEGARGYNFLSVFDWTHRKGWDLLLRAYVEEFDADEDVALILKVHSSSGRTIQQIAGEAEAFIRAALGNDPERIPDIIFHDAALAASDMPALYRAADCFVLPTRGEGWGRPFMEAMALGQPVIGTNWSGNTAFMNEGNSYLLECEIVDVPEAAWRETPTFRGHRWAEPNASHLRRLMRRVYTDRPAARDVGAAARADIAARFSPDRVAAIMLSELGIEPRAALSAAA